MANQTQNQSSNFDPSKNLNDRIAIVTGSGRGLGAATALQLAKNGAHVVINDINPENAKSVANEIEKLGRRTFVSSHDVSDYKSANAFVDEVKSKFGRVDILINNAGITRDSMLHKLSEEKWDEVIRVNLKGPFNMGQACAKVMMEQKYGKIINLASVAYLGNIGQTNYSASKAGVVGMTSTWALELARHNINVNAIAPGFIDSVLTQQVPAEIKEKFIQRIPLKRIGAPEDIANLITFLVSDLSSYITGQVIHIDGGLTAGISS
jgi:3-oxoacyl-[acyl-carrier protein] reductase